MFRGDLHSADLVQARPRTFQILCDVIRVCQRTGVAPAGDWQPLVLTAWSAVHGLATLWIDGALPKRGLNAERLAPVVTTLVSRMFAALARTQATTPSGSRRPRPRRKGRS
jgi:hypothetical protein